MADPRFEDTEPVQDGPAPVATMAAPPSFDDTMPLTDEPQAVPTFDETQPIEDAPPSFESTKPIDEGSNPALVGEAALKGAGSAPFVSKAGVDTIAGGVAEVAGQVLSVPKNIVTNIKGMLARLRYGDEAPPSTGSTPELTDKKGVMPAVQRGLENFGEGARLSSTTKLEQSREGILKPSTALEQAFEGSITESTAPLARIVYSASQSLAPNVIGAAANMTKAVALLQGISEVAPGYWAARDRGLSPIEAAALTTVAGIGTYKLEKLGLESIAGRNAAVRQALDTLGESRLASAATAFAIEGGTEGLQQIYQNAVAAGYTGDFDLFKGVLESVLAGGLSGGAAAAVVGPASQEVPTVGSPAAPGVQPLEANVQMQGTEGQLTGPQPAAVPSAVQPGAAPASIASPAEPSFDGSERVTKKVLRTLPEPRLRTMAAEFGMANAETAPLDLVIDRVHRMQPLITERGTASTDIDARVDRSGLRGELEGLQQRLEVTSRDLRSGAQQAGRVAVSEGAGQEIQGWRSAGSAYPEGMSADTATALKNYLSGQLVTPKQLNEVEKALNYVSAQVSRDAGFDVEMQEPKAQLDMVAGDRLSIDGVPFVISRQLPDGSLELQGPTGARVIGMDDTTLIDRGSYQPGSEADRTMAEQATLDTIEGRLPADPGAAASLFPFETEATQPAQATETAPRPWQEVRRDIVAAMGPTKAARFDEIRVKESNEAAVQWAEQELNPVRDLGEGNQATRQTDGTWTLRDSQGDETPLDWDNADDQDILRVLEPDEHHKRTVATVAEITKGWSGPVTVTVVKNAEGLPEAVRSKVSATGAEGVYVGTSSSGRTTVYVFSDNVNAARAPVTAIHEAVGHAGIRAVLGNKLETVLDQIYGSRPKAQLEQIAKAYGLDLNTPEGRQEATEELIAQMAEWQQTNPGMWNRAIAAIRQALRSVGITNTWTDNDLSVLISKAREHVENRRGSLAGASSTSVTGTSPVTRLSLFQSTTGEPGDRVKEPNSADNVNGAFQDILRQAAAGNVSRSEVAKAIETFKTMEIWRGKDSQRNDVIITPQNPSGTIHHADGSLSGPAFSSWNMEAKLGASHAAEAVAAIANARELLEEMEAALAFAKPDESTKTAAARTMAQAKRDDPRRSDYVAMWTDALDQKEGGIRSKLAALWQRLTEDDDTAVYPENVTAKEPSEIAEQISLPRSTITGEWDGSDIIFRSDNGGWIKIVRASGASPEIYAPDAKSKGKERGGGAQMYQAALAWAHNNNKKIHPSNALSAINIYRRTSNMLASALRYGTTKHMIPDADQKVSWKNGAHGRNLAALALREKQFVLHDVPEIESWRYDFDSDTFLTDEGKPITSSMWSEVTAEARARGAEHIGVATAKRAVITNSAIQQLHDRTVEELAGGDARRRPGLTGIRYSLPQPDYNARSRAAALAAIKRKQAAKGKVMSQFAERVAMDAGTSTPDADRIMQNRGSWRTPQDLAKMKGDLRSATEGELYDALNARFDTTSPEGQTAGLALGELMNRRLADNRPISDLIDSGAKLGRTLGQLLRQYGEIKTSTPAGAVSVIEAEVKKAGRALTDAQRTRLITLADSDIKARRAFQAAQQMHEQLFNDQTAAAVDSQGKAANEASTAFVRAARDVMPPNVASMLTTMLQGNLLTPMSQFSNVVGNLAMIPMRSSAQSIAAAADALDVFLRRNVFKQSDAQRSVLTPFIGSREAARGAVAGARDAGRQFISGPDTVAGESYRGFRPFTALLQGLTGSDMSVDPASGKVRKTDRALRLIEGTFGAAPEAMLRALQFGDMPIREATRRKTLVEIAKIRGLSGPALEKFVSFPDDTAAALADKESREAVFQQDNRLASWWSSLPEHMQTEYQGVARVLQKTITPYTKTPLNLLSEGLQYAIPELSMAKAIINYKNGNRRDAYLSLGKAATGWMVLAAGQWLIARGLMSGDPDEDDKYRQLQYSTVAPNTVNMSGLARAKAGGDPAWKEGDRLVGFNKLGFVGLLLNIMANRGRRAMQETATPADWEWLSIGRTAELGATALQMPMLKGSASLIEALDNPKKVDSWMNAWFETASSVALPNTLAALNRVTWDYLPERKGDTRMDSFANIWKAKLFQADELPLKRDMFGRPIKATPDGTTPIAYQLIDVTKSREIPNDPKIRAIWNVYNATLDSGVIPNTIDRTIKDPKLGKRDLTVKEYNRLQELVGKYRGAYLDALTKTPAWLRAGQEARAKQLKDIWSDSRERALTAFWTEMYNPNGVRLLRPADQQILASKP